MPETEVDRRQWRLLLLSHDILTSDHAADVVDWADRSGVGLYQLPLPAHALRPLTAGGRRSRPRVAELREELADLRAAFADVADYLTAGYQVLGLAVTAAAARGQAGQTWLHHVRLAAETVGVELASWVLPELPPVLAEPGRRAS